MSGVPFRDRVLCSINEAAAATGASRSKVYQWIKDGRIRRTKIIIASLLELAARDSEAAAS
jgi:hypothetical protein